MCLCGVCVTVCVCESVREEGSFSSQPPAALFAFTGDTKQSDLFCFRLEKGKGTVLRFCAQFSTVDRILMYTGTHERQRE